MDELSLLLFIMSIAKAIIFNERKNSGNSGRKKTRRVRVCVFGLVGLLVTAELAFFSVF